MEFWFDGENLLAGAYMPPASGRVLINKIIVMKVVEAERVKEAYKDNKGLLSPREKDIITRYYGINPQVRHTLNDLGEKYGVTRERIRQIKVIALEKLGIKK